jgi:hypothetical protein
MRSARVTITRQDRCATIAAAREAFKEVTATDSFEYVASVGSYAPDDSNADGDDGGHLNLAAKLSNDVGPPQFRDGFT